MKKKLSSGTTLPTLPLENSILVTTNSVKGNRRSIDKTKISQEATTEIPSVKRESPKRSKKSSSIKPLDETLDKTLPLDSKAIRDEAGLTDPLIPSGLTPLLSLVDTIPAGKNKIEPIILSCQGVECAYASDVGQIRSNNEDNLAAFMALVPGYAVQQELIFGFFVVADGMGGYERGEVASQIAVQTATTKAIEQIYLKTIAGKAIGNVGETVSDTLVSIIDQANYFVVQQANLERKTMGTTLVCALLVGNMIYTGNVGDSRLYGLRRDSKVLEQLTTDHSVVQRLVETGQMTAEEALLSPQRSLLYRSLGQQNSPPADTTLLRISDYSQLMLCSDGLWDMVEDSTIEQILIESSSAAIACRRLINAANHNGGEDNVSAMVIKLD